MVDLLAFFFFIILAAALVIFIMRYRTQLVKFIKDPKYGSTWYPTRETYLKRNIEDAEAELKYLEERKAETEG